MKGGCLMAIRVLHMLHSMNRGGAETMLMNYYRNLDRTKVQFDFLLTYEGTSDYEDEILSLGGRVFHLTPLTLKTMKTYCKDVEVFLKTHPEYQIVHSHTSSKSAIPLRIAKKCGVPVRISHSHNMILENRFSPKEVIRKVLKKPLRKVSTHNFACSKDAAIWLYGEDFWKNGKVRIMKNAIDLERFSFQKEKRQALRKEYDLEDAFVVGHVGRFDLPKNHDFLLKIFAEIKKQKNNAILMLVGDGARREEIKRQAEQLGLDDAVRFMGIREDVPDLLHTMDVFLFPSLSEGLGIVLIEAQTCGLPCFTSKDVVPKEAQISNLLTFISLEDSPKYWADCVLQTDFSKERVSHATEATKHGYDIKKSAKDMQNFYLKSR